MKTTIIITKRGEGYIATVGASTGQVLQGARCGITPHDAATWAASATKASDAKWDESSEGRDFLSLAEPIKVGHHSEGRHRALIARNHARMDKSMELAKKAESHADKSEYWEAMTGKIDLSMPESIEYFTHKLAKLEARHAGLLDGSIKRDHSMTVSYSSTAIRETRKKIETAKKLWLIPEENQA